MHEKAKCVRFIYMQPQKVKLKSVQINMIHVSYNNTFTVIPSIRPTCTQSCVWNDQIKRLLIILGLFFTEILDNIEHV